MEKDTKRIPTEYETDQETAIGHSMQKPEQKTDQTTPDWIKRHIEQFGREPNLFDGA